MDLGECSKIHDLALRADYEIASKERDLFFELDVSALHCVHCGVCMNEYSCVMSAVFVCTLCIQAVDHLESFIVDCDRRTELAKKRLAETQEEISAEVAAKVRPVRCIIKSPNIHLSLWLCNRLSRSPCSVHNRPSRSLLVYVISLCSLVLVGFYMFFM